MKRKFWNWIRNETNEERTLVLNGEISDETWFGDEVTPVCEGAEYRSRRCHSLDQLSGRGCVCGSTDLQHAHGVQGECDGEGGCAGGFCGLCHCYGRNHGADVMMMIHNPMTIAIGDSKEMQKAGEMLDEVKESIMNAYGVKTGLSRARISHLMDAESWFNAKKAVELGFADGILGGGVDNTEDRADGMGAESMMFSRTALTNLLLSKLIPKPEDKKTSVGQLEKRLNLLTH